MKTVNISLSPNLQMDDVKLALKLILTPTFWVEGKSAQNLEKEFEKMFSGKKALTVNSGRSGLQLIIEAIKTKSKKEVAVQALTCVAVPNAIKWAGASVRYCDVDSGYNIDTNKLAENISEKTLAIVIQNSFGIPADYENIIKIAKERKAYMIEDCALSLGGKCKDKNIGSIGDFAFFSFGRDKVISSVFGGIILCSQKDYDKLRLLRDKLPNASYLWTLQQLLHPVLTSLILPLYNFGIGKITVGKILLWLFQKTGILSKAVYEPEKLGKNPGMFPKKMPNALAELALNQLKKLSEFNKHRKDVADFYDSELSKYKFNLPRNGKDSFFVRYPIYTKNAKNIIKLFKKNGIIIGDWYKKPIVPVNSLETAGYKLGSCPNAERFAGNLINLPTYPNFSLDDAKRIVDLLKHGQL